MPLQKRRFENIEGKVFLVTGGAAGVGAGLVRTLLLENARYVAFLDVADKEGTILETELLSKFSALKAKFIKCDISDEAQLGAAFKQVFDKYRRLDVVINNAAVLGTDDVDFKKIVDINLTGTISSTLKAIELMSADKGGSGGAVVNVSSLLALKQTSHLPVYASTKLGVLQFSNSIGADLFYCNTKVRVLTVCLGPTDTAIIHKINISNFDNDCTPNITSRAPVRQKVESAANGILEVLSTGETSSTWMVADDKPPLNISKNVSEGFETMLQSINFS